MSAMKFGTFGEMKSQGVSEAVSRRAGTESRLELGVSCFLGFSHTPGYSAATGAKCLELGPRLAFLGCGASAKISSFSETPPSPRVQH